MPIQRKETAFYQVTSDKGNVLFHSTSYSEHSSRVEDCCSKVLKYTWVAILLTIIVAATFIASCFVLLKNEQPMVQNEVLPNEQGGANYTLRLIPRSQWTSYPGVVLKPLPVKPARYVVVCHTAGTFCSNAAICTNVVKSIETWHRQIGFASAWYNFMIGGDGLIYEGRGWDKEGGHSTGFNCASIGVAFLGNFEIDQLTPSMIEAYNVLIEEGERRGALSKDYKMVGHFQVKSTASPGANIKELLKTWPHWGHLKKEDINIMNSF